MLHLCATKRHKSVDMKIENTRLAILKSCIFLSIGFILTLSQLHGQVHSVAKVKNDFKRLLARPSVPLNPTHITSITTDSVIMDRGFSIQKPQKKSVSDLQTHWPQVKKMARGYLPPRNRWQ